MWEKIFEIIPELKHNVTDIHCDFEVAQISSAKSKFPNARILGCNFHYKNVS